MGASALVAVAGSPAFPAQKRRLLHSPQAVKIAVRANNTKFAAAMDVQAVATAVVTAVGCRSSIHHSSKGNVPTKDGLEDCDTHAAGWKPLQTNICGLIGKVTALKQLTQRRGPAAETVLAPPNEPSTILELHIAHPYERKVRYGSRRLPPSWEHEVSLAPIPARIHHFHISRSFVKCC
jgi:hypothetical protein